MIVTKFGQIWPSSFRGEDFCKSLRTTDDGREVMRKAHLTFQVRWAKTIQDNNQNLNFFLKITNSGAAIQQWIAWMVWKLQGR